MDKKDIINWTLIIIGWLIAIIQSYRVRKIDKENKLADRRFSAYSEFLKKMDEISGEMNKIPQKMMSEMTINFLSSLLNKDEDPNKALITYNEKLVSFLSDSLKPMSIVKSELSSLRLVASDEMVACIDKMQTLSDDLYNDFSSCISSVNPNNTESFQNLKSMGQNQRLQEFTKLYTEMTDRMRKEIQIS